MLPVPSVTELHSAQDGEGLEISGYFSTWDEDSAKELFHPRAFDAALPNYLRNNPVVLENHLKSSPPIGKVTFAEVRPNGLWGKILLPKPAPGTKAWDTYAAAKNGLFHNFSVGGLWSRIAYNGKTVLFCDRLAEISLATIGVNEHAKVDGIASVIGVKAYGDEWLPADDYEEQVALRRAAKRLTLAEMRLDLAEMRIRRRR